jgi:hypothetical protein
MAGLFSPGYIAARLAWAAIALGIVVVAGLVYRPHRATQRQLVPGRLARWTSAGPPPVVAAVPVLPKRIAVPLLGHATWHAYKELVVTDGVPLRYE